MLNNHSLRAIRCGIASIQEQLLWRGARQSCNSPPIRLNLTAARLGVKLSIREARNLFGRSPVEHQLLLLLQLQDALLDGVFDHEAGDPGYKTRGQRALSSGSN